MFAAIVTSISAVTSISVVTSISAAAFGLAPRACAV
jgi:hypothetical protein